MAYPLKMVIFHSYVSLPEDNLLETRSELDASSRYGNPDSTSRPVRCLMGWKHQALVNVGKEMNIDQLGFVRKFWETPKSFQLSWYPLVNIYTTMENHHAMKMGKSTISTGSFSIAMLVNHQPVTIFHQWPFQDPKLEVPTIYKACFSGLCKGI